MKLFIVGFVFIFASVIAGQSPSQISEKDYVRVEPGPSEGFTYPYYLYVPSELRTAAGKEHTILVLPNNTGQPDDDLAVHDAHVKKRMPQAAAIASMLKTAILMPVFPRPKSDWKIYTQALDRDSMVTGKKEFRRLDLQLIAMIDDARSRLAKQDLKFDKRVLLNGFSAQGMFVNRFTFLHPERVKAAVIGSPGGWPIVPVSTYQEKQLRYPIGTADLRLVAGQKLHIKALKKVPMFIFLGDQDDNDSVPFDDSYDDVDRDLIMPLLGKTPVKRWEIARTLYQSAGLNAEFRLYPGVKHAVTEQMRNDILAFLTKHSQ